MKYICLGFMDEEIWGTLSESERQTFMDACFIYDEALKKSGHFVSGEALQPARYASSLRWRHHKVSVTDGPFVETKEQIGGIMIIEANDLNHAIRLMSKHPSLQLGRGGNSWEIRPAADLTSILEESRQRRDLEGKNGGIRKN